MTALSVCDLNALDLSSYFGRQQLRTDLETLGVSSDVSLWVADLVEDKEAQIRQLSSRVDQLEED
jgi:hypothetical protein